MNIREAFAIAIFIGGSAGLVVESACKLKLKKALLVRDPDGHAILVEEK